LSFPFFKEPLQLSKLSKFVSLTPAPVLIPVLARLDTVDPPLGTEFPTG